MTIEQDIAALRPEITRLLKQIKEMGETQQTLFSRLQAMEQTVQGFATALDDIQTALGRSVRRP